MWKIHLFESYVLSYVNFFQGWLSVDNNRALTITPKQVASLESPVPVSTHSHATPYAPELKC